MDKYIKATICDTVSGSCGLGVMHDFHKDYVIPGRYSSYKCIDKAFVHAGGTGFFVAMFVVGDEICDETYEVLKAQHTIVYESPVRRNSNSGNEVFFCIFDGGEGMHGFEEQDNFYSEL